MGIDLGNTLSTRSGSSEQSVVIAGEGLTFLERVAVDAGKTRARMRTEGLSEEEIAAKKIYLATWGRLTLEAANQQEAA